MTFDWEDLCQCDELDTCSVHKIQAYIYLEYLNEEEEYEQ